MFHLLPPSCSLLLITHYSLLITHYSLLITHYPRFNLPLFCIKLYAEFFMNFPWCPEDKAIGIFNFDFPGHPNLDHNSSTHAHRIVPNTAFGRFNMLWTEPSFPEKVSPHRPVYRQPDEGMECSGSGPGHSVWRSVDLCKGLWLSRPGAKAAGYHGYAFPHCLQYKTQVGVESIN